MPKTKAKDVVLEILRTTGGKWDGKLKLYKTFYFAHLYYVNQNPGLLTTYPIARMPEGPGIDQGTDLLNELRKEGLLTIELSQEGPYPEYRYQLTENGVKQPRPPVEAQLAIKQASGFCYPKSGAELSQITHDRSRSWRQGRDGDILDIYIDLIPDDDYQAGKVEIERLDQQLTGLLGSCGR
jgi:hypothetical protein